MTAPEEPGMGPVIRDNRRIDPVTGQARRAARGFPAGRDHRCWPAGGARHTAPAGPTRTIGTRRSKLTRPRPRRHRPRARPRAAPLAVRPGRVGPGQQAAEPAGRAHCRPAATPGRVRQLPQAGGQGQGHGARARGRRRRSTELLPVLDAIGQAREHGELSGGFKSVADSLQAVVGKLGPGQLRAARRRLRPEDPRGTDPHLLRRRHRGHLRGDLPARLQGGRSGSRGPPA